MISLVPYVHAATLNPALGTNVDKIVNPIFTTIVDPLLLLAFAIATVVFVYGVIQVITNQVDTEAHTKGKLSMIWGVVGLFLMISAWGIIYIISNTVKGL